MHRREVKNLMQLIIVIFIHSLLYYFTVELAISTKVQSIKKEMYLGLCSVFCQSELKLDFIALILRLHFISSYKYLFPK